MMIKCIKVNPSKKKPSVASNIGATSDDKVPYTLIPPLIPASHFLNLNRSNVLLEKAPKALVDSERSKLNKYIDMRDKLKAQIKDLQS